MGELDLKQLLEKLDFNGTHSGDLLAAAYFRESAIAIRLLQGERDHYQRSSRIEGDNARRLRNEVRQLELARQALMNSPPDAPEPTP